MFVFRIEPRLSETDGLGHINNTHLPVWFEEARKDLFRIFNPTFSLQEWNLILKKYEIEFLRQIRHDQLVEITTAIEHIGTRSLVVVQVARQSGNEVAVGRTVLIYFDYTEMVTAEIPGRIRSQLEQHLCDSP